MPLMDIGTSGLAVGISRHGTWLVGDSSECVPVRSRPGGVRMLPVLEKEPEPTVHQLAAILVECKCLVEGGHEGPLLVAIETALLGGSDYWAGLAVEWLRVLAPSSEILEILEQLVNQPWASQKTRHAARKVLRERQGQLRT